MNNDEFETLDFDDFDSETNDIETLDIDEEVSNSIDEVLDASFPTEKKKKNNNNIFNNLNNSELDTYVPSIKDFNIKSAKTKKVVKKAMLYTIIFMLFTFEFFINKAGDTLNDLRVYASSNNPIMIIKNYKYGFIDHTGMVLSNTKYSYAENYINGYAIVKDENNLPLIIDKGGKEVVNIGDYFSMHRAGDDIIVSKTTKKGLKYGILRSDLKQVVDFKYDTISYENGIITFVNNNYAGIINKDYKEIYKFKLNENDSKNISIVPSYIDGTNDFTYAAMTLNKSSQIINVKNGNIITQPTLNKLVPLDNNVFYEEKGNIDKEYYYINNDKIVIDSIDYNSLEMPSLKAGVLKAFTKSFKYEVLANKTGEIIDDLTVSDSYFGDDAFIYKTYDDGNEVYKIVKDGEISATIDGIKGIKKGYKNGFAIVVYDDDTYGYVDVNGNLLNEEHYSSAYSFDEYGEAICKKDNKYGVINKNNKVIMDFEYKLIKSAPSNYKKNTSNDSNTVFYTAIEENYYKLYNKNGKKINNSNYSNVIFDKDYGFVKLSSNTGDSLLITSSLYKIPIDSMSTKYEAYDNYVIVNDKYYNLKGKVIYVLNNSK